MAKLKVAELKKHLKSFDKEDLIRLIVQLSKTSKEAQNYLVAEVQGEAAIAELYEEAKNKIKNEFFPQKGEPKFRLSEAKKAISNFAKYTDDKLLKTDLMLYYVELGTDFTSAYGDIDGPFYDSLASMFSRVTKACDGDLDMLRNFGDRLEVVYSNAGHVGWGYKDDLAESYYSIGWPEDEGAK
ncbi:hypothetical protein BBH88_17465 [Planococcus antarcticus DSM 14505]|nr:DUF6155 family protein [Planococcus antarcticus]ANU11910.1 hypothetical protein BBH88_17465 [Planococcus antarcticus DSM 14505]